MTRGKAILITVGVVGLIGLGVYLWWQQYDPSKDFDVKLVGNQFGIAGLPRPGERITLAQALSGRFDLDLLVTNKFGISGSVTGYDLAVNLNGKELSRLRSSAAQPLPDGQPTPFKLRGTFNPLQVFKSVANLELLQQALSQPENVIIGVSGGVSIDIKGIKAKNIPINVSMSLKELVG
jgi:hypothetical protein